MKITGIPASNHHAIDRLERDQLRLATRRARAPDPHQPGGGSRLFVSARLALIDAEGLQRRATLLPSLTVTLHGIACADLLDVTPLLRRPTAFDVWYGPRTGGTSTLFAIGVRVEVTNR